jgi:hypothetical protein
MPRTGRAVEILLVCLAISVRLCALWILQSHHVPRSSYEHGEIAANLVAGRGFSIKFLGAEGPTSQQAPVYPILVALAFAFGGVDTPPALLLVEIAQSILGGVLVVGVLRLSKAIAPERPGIARIAALVVALHPTLIYAATHIQVATLATTLLTWTLAWAYRMAESRRVRDAVICGGLLALLALTDPILTLAGPAVGLALWLSRNGSPRQAGPILRLLTVVTGVFIAGIAPWTIRNFIVHGELVAIKSTFGYAFWQGNCALSEGTDKVVRASVERVLEEGDGESGLSGLNRTLWKARHEAGYIDDIALTQADIRSLAAVSEPERSRRLFHRALADLSVDPSRYLRLCVRRLRFFVFFDETNPKTRVAAYRFPHLGLTVFALVGLIVAPPILRSRLMPTVATVMLVTLFHMLTIVSARFHLPIEPILAIWGSCGLARWTASREVASIPGRHNVKRVGVKSRFGAVEARQIVGATSTVAMD